MMKGKIFGNLDHATVSSFGDEWSRFDQRALSTDELQAIFEDYFEIFPWDHLTPDAVGFDMGCGSGRWAKLIAPRVSRLNCIDASEEALTVARSTLADTTNVTFIHATANDSPLPADSQDFGYSLGVLHHIPETQNALSACVDLLKVGAPMLVYLYYRFDNRPIWFRMVWQMSDLLRKIVSRLPPALKAIATDSIAAFIYWPMSRLALLIEKCGFDTRHIPLRVYRNMSFYTMRTDSRDRFGTPLERRFTREEIENMMRHAGLDNIVFADHEPFWVAMGFKKL
jgi:ubiquinone/menaquinone biosynthesis C-methylase UbiE